MKRAIKMRPLTLEAFEDPPADFFADFPELELLAQGRILYIREDALPASGLLNDFRYGFIFSESQNALFFVTFDLQFEAVRGVDIEAFKLVLAQIRPNHRIASGRLATKLVLSLEEQACLFTANGVVVPSDAYKDLVRSFVFYVAQHTLKLKNHARELKASLDKEFENLQEKEALLPPKTVAAPAYQEEKLSFRQKLHAPQLRWDLLQLQDKALEHFKTHFQLHFEFKAGAAAAVAPTLDFLQIMYQPIFASPVSHSVSPLSRPIYFDKKQLGAASISREIEHDIRFVLLTCKETIISTLLDYLALYNAYCNVACWMRCAQPLQTAEKGLLDCRDALSKSDKLSDTEKLSLVWRGNNYINVLVQLSNHFVDIILDGRCIQENGMLDRTTVIQWLGKCKQLKRWVHSVYEVVPEESLVKSKSEWENFLAKLLELRKQFIASTEAFQAHLMTDRGLSMGGGLQEEYASSSTRSSPSCGRSPVPVSPAFFGQGADRALASSPVVPPTLPINIPSSPRGDGFQRVRGFIRSYGDFVDEPPARVSPRNASARVL